MFRILSKNKCKNCKNFITKQCGVDGARNYYEIPNYCVQHKESVSRIGSCDKFEPNSKTKNNYKKF